MSGPFFVSTEVGCIGGAPLNYTGIAVNGFSGAAALFIDAAVDHEVFEIFISGRLNAKERVCAVGRTQADKPPRHAKYKAVCSKVKP